MGIQKPRMELTYDEWTKILSLYHSWCVTETTLSFNDDKFLVSVQSTATPWIYKFNMSDNSFFNVDLSALDMTTSTDWDWDITITQWLQSILIKQWISTDAWNLITIWTDWKPLLLASSLSSAWLWDMLKSVYDANDDWIVNAAHKELFSFVNKTWSALNEWTIVYLKSSSSSWTHPEVELASNTTEATSSKTIWAVFETTADNAIWYIVTSWEVDNLDTSAYTIWTKLWLWATPWSVVTTPPSAPAHSVFIWTVTRSQNWNGKILYAIQNWYEIEELHNMSDVDYTSPVNADSVLVKDNATSLWKRLTLANLKTFLWLTWTNSWDVTLAWTPNYITIAWQVITRALINLTSHVTWTLPVANGWTWVTTWTWTWANVLWTSPTITTPVFNWTVTWTWVSSTGWVSTLVQRDANGNVRAWNLIDWYTTTASSVTAIVLTVASTWQQFITWTVAQTITLPVTSTLTLWQSYNIVNNSTQTVTINSSWNNLVFSLPAWSEVIVKCILTSWITAASWHVSYWVGRATVDTLTNKTLWTWTVFTLWSDATWDIYYRAAGWALTRLAAWTAWQVLTITWWIPSRSTPSVWGWWAALETDVAKIRSLI